MMSMKTTSVLSESSSTCGSIGLSGQLDERSIIGGTCTTPTRSTYAASSSGKVTPFINYPSSVPEAHEEDEDGKSSFKHTHLHHQLSFFKT